MTKCALTRIVCATGLLFFTVGCQSRMFHVERVPIDPSLRELQLSAVRRYGTSSPRFANGIQFTLRSSMRGHSLHRIYGGSSDGPFAITDLDAGTYELSAGGPTCGSYRTDVLIADGERVAAVFDVSAAYREAESSATSQITLAEGATATGMIARGAGLGLLTVVGMGLAGGGGYP